MNTIIMFVVSFLLGVFIVKIGIDNSRGNQHTKEIIQELREIKEILRDKDLQ